MAIPAEPHGAEAAVAEFVDNFIAVVGPKSIAKLDGMIAAWAIVLEALYAASGAM